jgi:hypothetical protein
VHKTTAAAGSTLFFTLAPGSVAGLVPWLLTGWQPGRPYAVPLRVTGAVLLAASAPVLIHAFVRFTVEAWVPPLPSHPAGTWSSEGCTVTFAIPCIWRCWPPSLARRWP